MSTKTHRNYGNARIAPATFDSSYGLLLVALLVLVSACSPSDGRRTHSPSGEPWPVPGSIEAEDFDEGTLFDPAYRDSGWGSEAPGNQWYRDTDVDIGVDPVLHLVDIGWIAAGEWLEYTIKVSTAGTYALTTRVATPRDSRYFHFELDGRDISGSVAVPNTGCWGSDLKGGHCFQEVTIDGIELPAGIHRLRFVADTGLYTIDRFLIQNRN